MRGACVCGHCEGPPPGRGRGRPTCGCPTTEEDPECQFFTPSETLKPIEYTMAGDTDVWVSAQEVQNRSKRTVQVKPEPETEECSD